MRISLQHYESCECDFKRKLEITRVVGFVYIDDLVVLVYKENSANIVEVRPRSQFKLSDHVGVS